MKKLISIILVVLTIFSLTAGMSFAAIDPFEGQPVVESVEFIDSYPVSKMELGFYDYSSEEEDGDESYYNLFYNSIFPYELKVTLSDGTKVDYKSTSSILDSVLIVDDDTSLIVMPFVDAEELVAAEKNGVDEVTVYVNCITFNPSGFTSLIGENVEYETLREFEVKKTFCTNYVKSIKPVSTLSNTVYEGAEYYEIGGEKFRVEYFDGTKKTYTVVENGVSADYSVPQYTLGGIEITADVFFGETEIFYIDNSYTFEVEEKPYPFKEINVTDYTFDPEVGLTSITYEIVAKKTYERTVDLTPYLIDGEPIPYFDEIDTFRGFYIYIYDDTPERDDSVFKVVLSIGETETLLEIENPNPTPKSLIARIIMFFVNLIKKVFAGILG